jgi:molybdopterin/thiamine biosynthesis adenylyltransferase
MATYGEFVKRNAGYIASDVQEKIRRTRVLIAGCGMGSTVPEAMLRAGFFNLALADGDRVEVHNLNRQNYVFDDVGTPKVDALKKRLAAVSPLANITAHNGWIGRENAAALVADADLVFDTIDFLSLGAIVALHDECRRQRKPVISALSAGFGAAALYFPPDAACSFRDIFGLPAAGDVEGFSYVERFGGLMVRLADQLEPDVVQAMAGALKVMEDGTPCPAPHTSSGALCAAALGTAIAVRMLAGKPVAAAPRLILLNMSDILTGGIDLMEDVALPVDESVADPASRAA